MFFQKFTLIWDIFVAFGKVGIFAYGGGPSMIPLMQEEVVMAHKWLTLEEFTDASGYGLRPPRPDCNKDVRLCGL